MQRGFIFLTLITLLASCNANAPKESTTTEQTDSTAVALVASLPTEVATEASEVNKCDTVKVDSVKMAELAEKMRKFNDTTVTVLYPKKRRAPKRKNWDEHIPYWGLFPNIIGFDNAHAFNYIFPLYGKVSSICLGDPKDNFNDSDYIFFNRKGDVRFVRNLAGGDATDETARKYKYNAKGILVGIEAENSHGWFNLSLNAEYDTMGNLIGRDCFASVFWLSGRITYKYDSKGNLLDVKPRPLGSNDDEDCILDGRGHETFRYDSRSNLIMSKSSINPGVMFTYKYDKNDNLVMAIEYHNNVAVRKSVYHYNSKGNIYKIVVYDTDGTEKVLTGWKYDYMGNIISIPIEHDHIKVTITYYK